MIDMMRQTLFLWSVVTLGSLLTVTCALLYFQRIRLERPAIGVFNGRDIFFLLFFIVVLPLLYLVLPSMVLTGFLILTFVSAMYITLRPLLLARYVWLIIPSLIVLNVLVTETLLGTRPGWQVYWILNSIVVLISVVGVSNLYVQGGMRLRHVSWFALSLGVYDGIFAFVFPITQKLADSFEGRPLDASIGFTIGMYSGNIGIGDLLVYSLFMVAAYKGFGKKGVISSFVVITIFGALLPAIAPLVITSLLRGTLGVVIPAQIFFGPAAFITYLWLSRQTPERSMAQWYSVQATAGRRIVVAQRGQRRARPVQPIAEQGVGGQ